MTGIRCIALVVVSGWVGLVSRSAVAGDALPDNDVIMRALSDELHRSMNLQLEDLEKPYFIQFTVDDTVTYQLAATYGAITDMSRDRSRTLYGQVRVGSYELDNTNFEESGGFFGRRGGGAMGVRASLPLDDDYMALRQAIWWAVDQEYKDAVETLTKKEAYMRDKNLEDRPDDFTEAPPVEHLDPGTELVFDKDQWKQNLKKISGRFKKYPIVQDSNVQMFLGAGHSIIANSEGTRLRVADEGVLVVITAEVQADDGMRLSSSLSYSGDVVTDLPSIDTMLKDIDGLVEKLTAATKAPILDHYTGPVLFDDAATAQMFRSMLASGVAAKPDPVGSQRRRSAGAENLENRLNRSLLPDSFQVYDDPSIKRFGDEILFGHYRYDEEGVPAQRVDIVVDGELKDMVLSRVPTKKLSGSNGHARRPPGSTETEAAIGCLFVEDKDAVANDDLKAKLIEAAKDAGLEYGLRVSSIRSAGLGSTQSDLLSFFMRMQRGGGRAGLGDPVFAYKVYVDDGHEELVRGAEFGTLTVRELRDIIASGKKPAVYNYIGLGFAGATPPSTIVAPPVLFEEVELSKIEQEFDKQPILKAPLARDSG